MFFWPVSPCLWLKLRSFFHSLGALIAFHAWLYRFFWWITVVSCETALFWRHFFVFHVKHCKFLSRGRGGVPVISRQIFFFVAELVAFYNRFTWNICCFDDNQSTHLGYYSRLTTPNSTHFLAFRLFFSLAAAFSSEFIVFYLSFCRAFSLFCLFFVFSFILPQYMQSKCALRRIRVLFHAKHCFSDVFAEKVMHIQSVSPLCAGFEF